MRIKPRRLAHRVTTAHLQAAYPFISEGGLGSDGVYIGRDVFGGSFCYDCFTLYGREITGPNMLVIGQIGYAKSSLVKCLDEDTEVVDPVTGVPRTIAEVYKDTGHTKVLTLDGDRLAAVPITAKVDTGLSECLRVTLASGRSVVTTPEHPFLMRDGWRRADQLSVGETAATPARIPFPEEPVRIGDEEIDFLAVMLAQGRYPPSRRGAVRFASADPEVLERMRLAGERLGFGMRQLGGDAWALPGGGAAAVLRRFGVAPARQRSKELPEVVYRLAADQLARFVAVFWACGATTGTVGASVPLASERLARQLQHLLLRFGIHGDVLRRSTAAGKALRSWQLRVDAHHLQRLLDQVPLWGAERERLAALAPSGDAAAPFDSDVAWERIVAIEEAGERHVYDLTVESTACFVANDVVVHNTYLWRQMLFGRTAWVIDPKGEYEQLAAFCGTEPIRFRSGGSLRLNPLDPMIGGDAQLALLRSIAGVMLGRNLRPEEDACLERAHHEAVIEATNRRSQPTVPQVVNRLLEPSDATAHELRTSTPRLAEDGRQLALALRRMGSGDLRGIFDGPTSRDFDLSGRLVVFNLRDVKDEARPILMACTAAWLQGSWARNDGTRRIVVLDEAWVVLRHLAIARWLRESWKLARQYGVQNIAVMHRLSDLTAAGDAGSEQVQLAKGLLEDSETRVIYRQSPGEVEQARELLGLTQTECDQIPSLERGEALWRVGRRSFIVQHRIEGTIEREIVDTDANMDPRSAPWAVQPRSDEAAGGAS